MGQLNILSASLEASGVRNLNDRDLGPSASHQEPPCLCDDITSKQIETFLNHNVDKIPDTLLLS